MKKKLIGSKDAAEKLFNTIRRRSSSKYSAEKQYLYCVGWIAQ